MTNLYSNENIQPLLYVISKDNRTLWDLFFSPQEELNSSQLKEEMKKQGFDEITSQEVINLWDRKCVTIQDLEVVKERYEDIEFSPGHPIPGYLYRQHPLKSKKTTYVEYQSYYSLLLEEKQAELTKLLFELGAKEIYILNTTSSELNSQFGIKADSSFTVEAEGNLGNNTRAKKKIDMSLDLAFDNMIRNQNALSKLNYYSCIGKPWNKQMKINERNYEWLPYSPEWDTIIKGRIDNQLKCALIRLTIDISNTMNSNFSMKHGMSFDAEVSTSGSVSSEHKSGIGVSLGNENGNQSLRIIKVRFPEDFPENNNANDRLLEYLRNNNY
jgi:hypothetical protein